MSAFRGKADIRWPAKVQGWNDHDCSSLAAKIRRRFAGKFVGTGVKDLQVIEKITLLMMGGGHSLRQIGLILLTGF